MHSSFRRHSDSTQTTRQHANNRNPSRTLPALDCVLTRGVVQLSYSVGHL